MSNVGFWADPHESGSFIISEANKSRSREQVVIAGGSGLLPFGTVLGKVTATGKFVPSPDAASDGSQTAVAVLFEDTDASGGDVVAGVVARDAEVYIGKLNWDVSVSTDAKKLVKSSQLAAAGIIVRSSDDPQGRAATQLKRSLGW